MKQYLEETVLLNYNNGTIQSLVRDRKWDHLNDFDKINQIYLFVRDEVLFGYNIDDAISASSVLADGYGQCNTKGTLFMALLRAVKISCRTHGFTIHKELQKEAMTGFVYKNAPQNIVHSWVEVLYNDTWYNLEAFIIDKKYLTNLQNTFAKSSGSFCGYGVATADFKNPVIDWNENDTYIQKEGINQDFGIYDNPDDFFKEHFQRLSAFKKFLFQKIGRHLMNRNVKNIRNRRA